MADDNQKSRKRTNFEKYSPLLFLGIPCALFSVIILSEGVKEKNITEHLAQNAVPIVRFEHGIKNYWSFNQYEDVNHDGIYEHTAEITNLKTGGLEKRLVEFNGKQIVLRPYRVEGKEIVYLD